LIHAGLHHPQRAEYNEKQVHHHCPVKVKDHVYNIRNHCKCTIWNGEKSCSFGEKKKKAARMDERENLVRSTKDY